MDWSEEIRQVTPAFGTYHLPRKEWPAAYGIEAKLPDSLGSQLMYPLRPRPPHVTLPGPIAADP
jgi:hypothetical protein